MGRARDGQTTLRACSGCGREFRPKRTWQKQCSPRSSRSGERYRYVTLVLLQKTGKHCTISVTFKPARTGKRNGSVTIKDCDDSLERKRNFGLTNEGAQQIRLML